MLESINPSKLYNNSENITNVELTYKQGIVVDPTATNNENEIYENSKGLLRYHPAHVIQLQFAPSKSRFHYYYAET